MLYFYHNYFISNLYYNSIVNFSKNIDIMNSKCYNKGGNNLPIISQFYGVIISMFFNDTDRHHLPHIHVQYAEYRCTFDFKGNVLSGNIPLKQKKLVVAWIELRKEDLTTLWNMLQSGNGSFTIEPLK